MSEAVSRVPSEAVSIVDRILADLHTPARVQAGWPILDLPATPVAGQGGTGAITADAELLAPENCHGQMTVPDEGHPE